MRDQEPVIVTRKPWNALLEALKPLGSLLVGPGLRLTSTLSGRHLSLEQPEPSFLARLVSGTGGGPYTFRRVRHDGTALVNMRSVDDPAVAYEANLRSQPIGTVVRLWEVGLSGEYRFVVPCECGESVPCCPGVTLPETLYVHDLLGSHPIVRSPEESSFIWGSDCLTANAIGARSYLTTPPPGGGPTLVVGVPVESVYKWFLQCEEVGGIYSWSLRAWTQTYSIGGRGSGTNHYAYPFGGEYDGTEACAFDVPSLFMDNVGGADCVTCSPPRFQFNYNLHADTLGAEGIGHNVEQVGGIFALFGYGNVYIDRDVSFPVFVTDSPDPPSIDPVNFCLTVRTCQSPGGALISGASVVLKTLAGVPVGSPVTTGVDGLACFEVSVAGAYRAVVTVGDCDVEVPVMVGICDDDVEVEAVVCCITLCLKVIDADTDGPLEAAVVSLPGHEPVTTGSDGIACFEFTPAQVAQFPDGAGGCATRTIGPFAVASPVEEVTGDTHLYRCEIYIDVECGEDGETPVDVVMEPFPPGTTLPHPDNPTCCGPYTCSELGTEGLVYLSLNATLSFRIRPDPTNTYIGFPQINWSGQLHLNVTAFNNGNLRYESDCINLGVTLFWNDTEGEPCMTWSRMKLVLDLCGSGNLLVRILADPACTDSLNGVQSCPSCDDKDLFFQASMASNPAPGAQTDRLCFGEFLDANGSLNPSCFIPWAFAASGAVPP